MCVTTVRDLARDGGRSHRLQHQSDRADVAARSEQGSAVGATGQAVKVRV